MLGCKLSWTIKRTRFAYCPFSEGPRCCIGQQLAMMEAKTILARLVQVFKFKLVKGQSQDVLEQTTLKPKGKCQVYIMQI
ncbi:cholesterol 24-hydroxylase-like [Saccoglossus kowalevskii]